MALNLGDVIDRSIEDISFVDHSLVRRTRVLTVGAGASAISGELAVMPLAIVDRRKVDSISILDAAGHHVGQVAELRERAIVLAALLEICDLAVLDAIDQRDRDATDTSKLYECRRQLRVRIEQFIRPPDLAELGCTAEDVEFGLADCVDGDLESLHGTVNSLAPIVAFFSVHELVLVELATDHNSGTTVFEISYVEPVTFGDRDWNAGSSRSLSIDLWGSVAADSYSLSIVPPRDVLVSHIAVFEGQHAFQRAQVDSRPSRPMVRIRSAPTEENRDTAESEGSLRIVATVLPRATGMLRALPICFAATAFVMLVAALKVPGADEPGRSAALVVLLLPVGGSVMITGMTGSEPHPLTTRLLIYPRLFTWALASMMVSVAILALATEDDQVCRLLLLAACSGYGFAALHIGWIALRIHASIDQTRSSGWGSRLVRRLVGR